ncbi:hypothetical protein [Paenibacillus xylanexedens]|uniref:hypothetical protein n=1 Tax=Paenibacillus xylanexedens TaxID=528191 RepID=UPI0011A02431|nr:hypothetical protein [Paenibacillus xylanexedens]
MLRFIDDELKTQTYELLSFFEKNRIEFEFYDLDNPEDYEEDIIIDLESKMNFGLPSLRGLCRENFR